jgi:hypothetical protein
MPSVHWLNLELRDSTGAPLADRAYALTLPDGTRRHGKLDAEGRLHEPVSEVTGPLLLDVAERRLALDVEMPAADTTQGAQERLNHLNYFAGKVDCELGRFTKAALERFQRDHGLPITGVLDDATAVCLREAHGA